MIWYVQNYNGTTVTAMFKLKSSLTSTIGCSKRRKSSVVDDAGI